MFELMKLIFFPEYFLPIDDELSKPESFYLQTDDPKFDDLEVFAKFVGIYRG